MVAVVLALLGGGGRLSCTCLEGFLECCPGSFRSGFMAGASITNIIVTLIIN